MKCYIDKIVTDKDVVTDIKQLIPDAGLRRRMSKVIKTAVATAIETISGVENIDGLDGIITATGWGCLTDSERFLRNIIVDKEQLLNPTPFIQSTFNTVGGQIALLRHNHCYNVTFVNRSHSFEDALLDAMMRIEDGESSNLLVGAFDEQTASQHRIMERMGTFRGVEDGEGSVFVHLKAEASEYSLAQISAIDFPAHTLSEQECRTLYLSGDNGELLYNSYREFGLFPTASAQTLAIAVEKICQGAKEVVIYNEYFGATPAVVKVQCVG